MELNFKDYSLSSVADVVGLPLDQIHYLFGEFFALFLAYFLRVSLHPSRTSVAVRHWTALSAGICLAYFCFGKQVLLVLTLAIICYCILQFCPENAFHHVTLFVSICFLSAVHIKRQFFQDYHISLDISGPLMVVVQKATALAYNISDGKEEFELTPIQRKFIVRHRPSALEYFSYMMCFHSILAGPFFMFVDYQDFIHGTQYIRHAAANKKSMTQIDSPKSSGNNNNDDYKSFSNGDHHSPKEDNQNKCSTEPDPTAAAATKMCAFFVSSTVILVFRPIFPAAYLADSAFVASSMAYKLFYMLVVTTLARQLYYTAWCLADAVCCLSGLGFNGYDADGCARWDLVTNVDVVGIEFGTSLKQSLDAWNMGTGRWLRFLVYDRVKRFNTLLTFVMSSVWHGFYPGYYLTFLGGTLFTLAARKVRALVRPRVLLLGPMAKRGYDLATFVVTRLCVSYMTFPFVLLALKPSIIAYRSIYFYLHFLSFAVLLGLPSRKKSTPTSPNSQHISKSLPVNQFTTANGHQKAD